MAKKKTKKAKNQSDGPYVLKLVLYFIVGSQWLWITNDANATQLPLPIGLLIGMFFIRHEHFQIDRKIEYAVLLVACLIGFWSQIGIYLH